MNPQTTKLNSRFSSKSILVTIGLLVLIVSLPVMFQPSANAASSKTSISLSYSLKTVKGQRVMDVALTARDAQFPNRVVVSLSSYYGQSSTPYNVQTHTVSTRGNGQVTYGFTVPFEGKGSYLFTACIYDSHGNLLAQASIDPLIEPEWRAL
jgi:uncharacterized membrane protein affecting hemolysin expression